MLRIIGSIFILCGCVGMGRTYSQRYRCRLDALMELESMLELMAGEISYRNASLPECCIQISGYLEPCFRSVFRTVAERMREKDGESFGEIFRQECQKGFNKRPLKTIDIDDFLEFTYQTGFSCRQMQLHAIEQSQKKLQSRREQLKDEAKNKCNVVMSLGILGGLLLIIVLW